MDGSDFRGTARFEVVARVGEGAVGVVFDARDREKRTRVALKALRRPSAETIRLLKNEFRAVQDIAHPNLVHLGELFEEGGQWFFTMEFVEGRNILAHVRESGECDEARLRDALRQLARGICALHRAGKVHRDVKPVNILVTPQGRVVLLDFGVMRDVARGPAADDEGIVGTVAYMAPEQAASEAIGPAADWYAVGVLLFEALTGRAPFVGSAEDVLERKLASEAPAPSAFAEDVPADLEALCIRLLQYDPASRPTDDEVLQSVGSGDHETPPSSLLPSTLFVGRRPELEVLERALLDVEAGAMRTVLVRGESGVGKSALVREFTCDAQSKDPALLPFFGKCYERESLPYKAFDTIVDDLAAYLGDLPPSKRAALLPENAALLARIFPALAHAIAPTAGERSGAAATDLGSPHELRLRVFATFRELFVRLARERRVVLVIDDLQWADADSLALLAEIVRQPAAPPLLVVAAECVTTDAPPNVAYSLPGDAIHLRVDKLAAADAEQLTRGLLRIAAASRASGSVVAAADIGAIAREAGGHPLFIDELVRQRTLREGSDAPLRLDDALWWRVSRLDEASRRVLELLAVAGAPISQQLAQDATATDGAEMLVVVGTLRAANLARTAGASADDVIEPYHDRVRESVFAHLAPDARATWHGRLARALEKTRVAEPEALAVHWDGAGDRVRAAAYAVRAADEATASLAFDHAARLYAVALAHGAVDEAAARAIKAKRADALSNAGRLAESADVQLELAAEAQDELAALDLRRCAAEQFSCSGRFDRGVELLRRVLARTGVYFPESPAVVIVCLLVARAVLRLRGLGFVARPVSKIPQEALVRIDAASSAGAAFSMSDSIRGSYFQTRTLLFALRAGDPVRVLRAMMMETCFSGVGGAASHPRTTRLLAAVDALAAQVGTAEAAAWALMARGYMHYMVAEWPAAVDAFARAEVIGRDSTRGFAFYLATTRTMLYRAMVYLGDAHALATRVATVLREAERQGDRYLTTNLRTSPVAFVGLMRGDPESVERDLEDVASHLASNVFHMQHYFHLIAQGQLDLYRGEARKAHSRITATWPALKRGMNLRVEATRTASLEHRARVAVAAAVEGGARDEALLAAAEDDARAVARISTAWAAASARSIAASVAAARGDLERARTEFGAAATAFDALGMRVYGAASRARYAQLVGGDEGAKLGAGATATLVALGAREPARLVAVYAPGFRE